MSKILIIDDEEDIRFILTELLEKKGFSTVEAPDGRSGIEAFRRESPDAVLLDHKMPFMDGFTTLGELRKIDPEVPVIIITAFGDIHTAVEAMRLGAFGFVSKPFDIDSLVVKVNRAIEKSSLEKESKRFHLALTSIFEKKLGRSLLIKKAILKAEEAATGERPVLLTGEAGTGKALLAEFIHLLGRRGEGPFVPVALKSPAPGEMEALLFGTGGSRSSMEAARGGTIYIEGLDSAPHESQDRLARALKEGLFSALDMRLIAGLEKDPLSLSPGAFSKSILDLLFDYNIHLPPLRERKEDIAFLAQNFLKELSYELDKPSLSISAAAMDALTGRPWRGNIRELKMVLRKTAETNSGEIRPEDLFTDRDI